MGCGVQETCIFSEAIQHLYAASEPLLGVKAMLPSLNLLFRSRHVGVDLTPFDGGSPQIVAILHDDEHLNQARIYEETIFLSPRYESAKIGGFTPVIRISNDFVQTRFRGSTFYREAFSQAGWADQLGISVRLENQILGINLHRDSPFSDDEAQLAQLLHEHLSRCFQAQGGTAPRAIACLWEIRLSEALTPQALPASVAKLFQQCVTMECPCGGLPVPVVRWMRNQLLLPELSMGTSHLRIATSEGALFLWLKRLDSGHFSLTVQERKSRYDYSRLNQFGLTGRQIEIAFWLTQGKTDSEMAILLDISPRTASKHIEAILSKLGCCNRTLAAVNIVEFLTTEKD